MQEITDLMNKIASGLKAAGYTLKSEKSTTPLTTGMSMVNQAVEPVAEVKPPERPLAGAELLKTEKQLAAERLNELVQQHNGPMFVTAPADRIDLRDIADKIEDNIPIIKPDESNLAKELSTMSDGSVIAYPRSILDKVYEAMAGVCDRTMLSLVTAIRGSLGTTPGSSTKTATFDAVKRMAPYLHTLTLFTVIEEIADNDSLAPELTQRCYGALCTYTIKQVILTTNQDAFAAAMKSVPPLTRDEYRNLFKSVRAVLVETEVYPKAVGGKFQQQVEAVTDAKTDAKDNPAKGKAEKQLKKDLVGGANDGWVQIARRIARTLAVNGPITIDDVTLAMAREHKVAPNEGEKAHVWKGAVFNSSEWSGVGQMPSRLKEAHGRPVTLWALKTWLSENVLNGSNNATSAFNLMKILSEFKRAQPAMPLERCTWYIGAERLSDDVRTTILTGKGMLYGIPVVFLQGSVGAVIMPPDYARVAVQPPQPQQVVQA